MDDIADRFTTAITELDAIAGAISPDDARAGFDDTTLQTFWRDWTRISGWAGALWRQLNEDLDGPARPVGEEDLDEVGGGG